MTILLIVLFILLAALLCLNTAYRASDTILHRKNNRKPVAIFPDQFKLPFENVIFKNKAGITLKGWFVPATQGSNKTIIFMHGWGMNKGNILANTYFLRDAGYNLFYFDFRGSGESGDGVTSIGYLEIQDADAAIETILQTRPAQAEVLGVYGLSMGAAVAVYEAAHNPNVKAIAAEGCYYSYEKVVTRWAKMHKRVPYFPMVALTLYFARKRLGLNPEKFSPKHNIRQLQGKPIFILSGSDDQLAPRHDARKLYAKASNPKQLWIVANAAHTDSAEVAGQQYKNRLEGFFTKYL
ncbi:MAG: alpha/beta hydrolase [Elusimicrobiota bacterium]|jgi:pimeloyl-ACP methyl ester carboxylesterase|nr:alpha/beta hydrolase [Elusimicrobiota bacterium]